jgi:DNA-binding HxlR family transcriptional regulator
LIIEASFLGSRRFDDFRTTTGLRRALLSDRLKRLVAADLMRKFPYSDSPVRHEYKLTEKGRDLFWPSLMMLRWEERWSSQDGKFSVKLFHKACGNIFKPVPICMGCGDEISPFDVGWIEGPGVGWVPLSYSRRRQQRDSVLEKPTTALMEESAQVLGDRWASLVIRALFTGLNKYDEILADSGMATNILAERLNWLTSIGMVKAIAYSTAPLRYEYRLTRKGVDYYAVLLMLLEWGDKYFASPNGPPLILKHGAPRSHKLRPAVCCSGCGEPVRREDVSYAVLEAEPQLKVGKAAKVSKPAARKKVAKRA